MILVSQEYRPVCSPSPTRKSCLASRGCVLLLFSEHALARLAVGPDQDRGGKGLENGISELNMLVRALVHKLVDAPRHRGHAVDCLVWQIHLHGNLLVLNRQAIQGGQLGPVSEHAQSLETLLELYPLQ